MEFLNYISNRLEKISPRYKELNKDMSETPLWYKLLSAGTAGALVGSTIGGCKDGFIPVSPNSENNPNTQEINPTEKPSIYSSTAKWLTEASPLIQDIASRNNILPENVNGFEIKIDGIVSATEDKIIKVQFTGFVDKSGLYHTGMHTPEYPDGVGLNVNIVDKGDNIFVIQESYWNGNQDVVVLEYPTDTTKRLESGQGVDIKFYPDEYLSEFLPTINPGEPLVVSIPSHPNFSNIVQQPFFSDVLVVDGRIEGIKTPTPSEAFNKTQEEFAKTGIFTLTPDAIEMETEEGIVPIENIKPNITDGSFTIVSDDKEYIANLKFIDEYKITFGYEDGNIVWDGENLKVIPFEIMELSTDPNKPSYCTFEQISSGELAWNERRNAKPFPADATNTGWGRAADGGIGGLYLQPGSIGAIQFSSFCKITGDFLGNENLYDVIGVEILNPDGSTSGFVHFFTDRRANYNTKYVIEQIKKGDLGIGKEYSEGDIQKSQDDNVYGPITRLYGAQGGGQRIQDLITEIVLSGVIPAEMETILLRYRDYDSNN